MKKIKLGYLYPGELNIYGDGGNIIALSQRAKWRKLEVELIKIGLEDHELKYKDFDILFIGGGQDKQQELVADDLRTRRNELEDALGSGTTMLSICGGYQLLGSYYQGADSQRLEALNIIGVYTEAAPSKSNQEGIKQQDRLVGNLKC